MLDALRFVQGAVAKKDFVAALTHFQIKNGFVKGHNGGLTLCAPIALHIDVTPKASTFSKAIATCKEVIQISQTSSGRLSIKSGKFRALMDCVEEGFPTTAPEGDLIELPNGGILKALKMLHPFIAEDASRPWARGILFRDQSAFATNNVVLMEHWLGYRYPVEMNIPKSAVTEMIRIGEEPIRMMASENSVTFFYSEDKWLKTQLYSLKWPDLAKVLSRESKPAPLPAGLWEALDDVEPFVNKLRQVWLREGAITTDPDDAAGAVVEVPGLTATGIYNVDYLIELSAVVQTMDLMGYPGPSIFFGEGIRGAIIGMRG
jgi:DNA polymerase III sliding clamp (beta) subunit (PCNA family)